MQDKSDKSRGVALALAFILGAFGAHRYYVGKNGSATAMLLLSCTLIGAVVTLPWAWIDIIRILVGSFEDKDTLPVKTW